MSSARVVGATVAVAVGLAAAGCGAGTSASHGQAAAAHHVRHSVTTGWPTAGAAAAGAAAAGAAPAWRDGVGAGCHGMPTTGPGSIGDMASLPLATAVGRSRLLTEIARAIRVVGIASSLNSAKAITFFAPDDRAFADLGRGNLTTLLADKSDLKRLLEYHIVMGRYTPAELARAKRLITLRGTVIVAAVSHGRYRVNNAGVICGNIQAANATVYIVSKVLVPIP